MPGFSAYSFARFGIKPWCIADDEQIIEALFVPFEYHWMQGMSWEIISSWIPQLHVSPPSE